MSRKNWDDFFMGLVDYVAEQSTCLRAKIGAVIVRDKRILATGFCGAPRGLAHCTDLGICYRKEHNIPSGLNYELCRSVHAEQNAIISAAYYGISVKDAIMYTTSYPCSICAKIIINSGIAKIICRPQTHYNDLARELLKASDVVVYTYEPEI